MGAHLAQLARCFLPLRAALVGWLVAPSQRAERKAFPESSRRPSRGRGLQQSSRVCAAPPGHRSWERHLADWESSPEWLGASPRNH